ncbi:MAG: NAD(P)-dependent alcohol dehydrogenase [Anaerolineales bacterium]|nr:NAD(P)-dependent alcohol dehydrogenase [Anaerolineales bacterium]
MKAIAHTKYGQPDVLELVDIEKPIPQDDEVLIKVRASSINAAEWYGMVGLPIARIGGGLFKPKDTRLGVDYSGIVEAVGKNRNDFKVGDEVFGARTGAYAEYVCVKNIIIPKPKNITFEEAASVPTAAITALQGLRDFGKIQAGQKVLINGASGGVGHFAVQIAKAFDTEVTAVCSTKNIEIARSSGADHVVDYTKENFTNNVQKYDLLLDVSGTHSWSEYKRVLKPDTHFVIVGAPKGTPVIGPLAHVIKIKVGSWRASQKVEFFIAKFNKDDMNLLKEFLETGKLRPFVEKTYPLSQTAEAMRLFGRGHIRGKIVLTM